MLNLKAMRSIFSSRTRLVLCLTIDAGLKAIQCSLDVLLYVAKLREQTPTLLYASDMECLRKLQENLMVYFDHLYVKVKQMAHTDDFEEELQTLVTEVKEAAKKVWQLGNLLDSLPELYDCSTDSADDMDSGRIPEYSNGRYRMVGEVIIEKSFMFQNP